MTTAANLLSAEQVKLKLKNDFATAQKIIIISAYITHPAVDWLINSISGYGLHAEVIIVSRVTPVDVMSGSTSLKALRACLDRGWEVHTLQNLHAKIYLIDNNIMYVGSSNFTTKGLKIFGEGNLEALVQVVPNQKDVEFVENILSSSTKIDILALSIMEEFTASLEQRRGDAIPSQWPEHILPQIDSLWVSDFPLIPPEEADINNICGDKFCKFMLSDKDLDKKELLRGTRVYSWLIDTLRKEENNECYFGRLSEIIHDTLKDDPAPYRKDVKQLLSNLLKYIEVVSPDEIIVDRPNYSQRIQLVEKKNSESAL